MKFDGELSSLEIDYDAEGVEFATSDIGNSSSALISHDEIWDVIDYLIDIAGPRAYAGEGR